MEPNELKSDIRNVLASMKLIEKMVIGGEQQLFLSLSLSRLMAFVQNDEPSKENVEKVIIEEGTDVQTKHRKKSK